MMLSCQKGQPALRNLCTLLSHSLGQTMVTGEVGVNTGEAGENQRSNLTSESPVGVIDLLLVLFPEQDLCTSSIVFP